MVDAECTTLKLVVTTKFCSVSQKIVINTAKGISLQIITGISPGTDQ